MSFPFSPPFPYLSLCLSPSRSSIRERTTWLDEINEEYLLQASSDLLFHILSSSFVSYLLYHCYITRDFFFSLKVSVFWTLAPIFFQSWELMKNAGMKIWSHSVHDLEFWSLSWVFVFSLLWKIFHNKMDDYYYFHIYSRYPTAPTVKKETYLNRIKQCEENKELSPVSLKVWASDESQFNLWYWQICSSWKQREEGGYFLFMAAFFFTILSLHSFKKLLVHKLRLKVSLANSLISLSF